MEVFHEAPSVSNFTPLSEHQSHTPASFYSGPPVLHHLARNAHLVIPAAELRGSPALSRLADDDGSSIPTSLPNGNAEHAEEDGHEDGHEDENGGHDAAIQGIDIWVTSEYFQPTSGTGPMLIRGSTCSKFVLYRSSKSLGISIPYPSISLHAIQRLQDPSSSSQVQGLYLQMVTSDGFDDHDPDGSLSLTLIPTSATQGHLSGPDEHVAAQREPILALFDALSACANLHPDPVSPSSSIDDQTGDVNDGPVIDYGSQDGLPPPMPGSGGWITAENMGQFFDEEGNWLGGGLGPGAGMVREREVDLNVDGAEEAEDGDGEETKWRRTE